MTKTSDQIQNAKRRLSSTSEERYKLSSNLFEMLTEVLNGMHKKDYSSRFWRIILAPYVSLVVNNYWLLNNQIIAKTPARTPQGPIFTDTDGRLNLNVLKNFVKSIQSQQGFKHVNELLSTKHNFVHGFHYIKALDFKYDCELPAITGKLPTIPANNEIRKVNRTYDGFSEKFVTNVIRNIPKFYIEYFDHLRAQIRVSEPEKKTFHISMISNIFVRYLVALYVENGAQLHYYQHGGFYGEYKYHNAYMYEYSIADKYHTWGWVLNKNDVPTKAFRLKKFSDNYKIRNNKTHDILMVYPYLYEVNKDRFAKQSKTFFQNIDRSKYPDICARPRPRSRLNRRANLAFIKNDVTHIDRAFTPLSELISKSKVVVLMNYPSTSLLECLYVDHPVIAILNNDDPSAIVLPYYEFLLENGILHDSMSSLVNHLNTTNVEEWWNELVKNPKYLEFKNMFLRKVAADENE